MRATATQHDLAVRRQAQLLHVAEHVEQAERIGVALVPTGCVVVRELM